MGNAATVRGLIVKVLSGSYFVKTDNGLLECRARGALRLERISPCVGDLAEVQLTDPQKGYLMAVAQRKNYLLRPPLANLDQLVIVSSTVDPAPNLLVLDKMLAVAQRKGIEPVLAFTKCDLKDSAPLCEIYSQTGYRVFSISNLKGEGVEELKKVLTGKVGAFLGNSGVGKSSLLNNIDSRFSIRTAEISQKLGRGRHTTRHVELYELPGGGYIADTPGFSTVDVQRFEIIPKEELALCFPEFLPYLSDCRFRDCSHTGEAGCAVANAVRQGKLSESRYKNYLAMYEEVRDWKEWEHRERLGR